METNDYQKIALSLSNMLNALSHPARLQIMLHLAKYKGCHAGSISGKLPLAKSTVSEHLSKLREAGLITCMADGVCSTYRISDEGFELIKSGLQEFIKIMQQSMAFPVECFPSGLLKPKVLSNNLIE